MSDIGYDRHLDQLHYWHEIDCEPVQTECYECGSYWEDCDSDGGDWYDGIEGRVCWDCYKILFPEEFEEDDE